VAAEVAVEDSKEEEVDLKLHTLIKSPDTRRKARIKMEKRQRVMVRSKEKGKTTIEDRRLMRTPTTIVTSTHQDLNKRKFKSQLTLKFQPQSPKTRGKLNQVRTILRRI
jgi:hypothetical protein